MTGQIGEDGVVTMAMSLPEYAVLSNLMGLAVSMMQRDEEQGVVFMKELSSDTAEFFAKMVTDGFAHITDNYKGDGVRETRSMLS